MSNDNTGDSRRLQRRTLLKSSLVASVGVPLGAGSVVGDEGGHETYDDTIKSHDGTELALTVHRPSSATPRDPVPMILHSHGWGGSRSDSPDAFQRELDRRFGVLSFDQRGFGDSGGQTHAMTPDIEGRDVIEILDYIAALEWVQRSDEHGKTSPRGRLPDKPAVEHDSPGKRDSVETADPLVFAMGGSYGGGYQFVGALTETALKGYTRFDALCPEITWFNLIQSLAPNGVVRSTWVSALLAASAHTLPERIRRGVLYAFITGNPPDGSRPGEPDLVTEFYRNGPSGFVDPDVVPNEGGDEEVYLDVPILIGHGLSDNLMNLNQGWRNFTHTLTEEAKETSAVVGYNGGHGLPNAVPPGEPVTIEVGTQTNACCEFTDLRLSFFEGIRDGTDTARSLVGAPYALTTSRGETCLHMESLDDREPVDVDGPIELEYEPAEKSSSDSGASRYHLPATGTEGGRVAESTLVGDVATTTGVGAPIHLPVLEGPATIAGIPNLVATVTTEGIEQRVFAGLSRGTSPATATVIQNNLLPLREPDPVSAVVRELELPGVAVEVEPDETLFLALSAVSDIYVTHGSRTPGMVQLEDLTVELPITTGRTDE